MSHEQTPYVPFGSHLSALPGTEPAPATGQLLPPERLDLLRVRAEAQEDASYASADILALLDTVAALQERNAMLGGALDAEQRSVDELVKDLKATRARLAQEGEQRAGLKQELAEQEVLALDMVKELTQSRAAMIALRQRLMNGKGRLVPRSQAYDGLSTVIESMVWGRGEVNTPCIGCRNGEGFKPNVLFDEPCVGCPSNVALPTPGAEGKEVAGEA